jgi:hypothetical protein
MEREILKKAAKGVAITTAAAGAGYAALVVFNRARYGSRKVTAALPADSSLNRFLPDPEVAEHYTINIDAPAGIVMAAAKNLELLESPLIRAIFRTREVVLGGEPDRRPHPTALMAQMLSIGWVVLAEEPGHEVVFGSVTQPWETAPVFRSIPPDQFRDFAEPEYVKIVWTLRADPVDEAHSVFRTETRACTTDAVARKRFRKYWAFVAPGVKLIRVAMLKPLKRAAEAAAGQTSVTAVSS